MSWLTGQIQQGPIPLRRPEPTSKPGREPLVTLETPLPADEVEYDDDDEDEDDELAGIPVTRPASRREELPNETNFAEEVFDTALLTVPFTFLYILLDL